MATPLVAGSSLPELSPDAAIHEFLVSLRHPMRLLVAVSGGSDSTGLLLALSRALGKKELPHTIVAATVDHGLRPAAAGEARQVAALCERLDIPHRILPWTGEKPAAGISAAARDARYRLLADAARSFGADAIVTGHTLDDQIETVAMRSRRSTPDALGLAGMAPATLYTRSLWILRPFLSTSRSAIRDDLRAQGYSWIDDPSNDDPRFERVRVRGAPPAIDPAAIEAAARRRETLSRAAADWLNDVATSAAGPVVTINLSKISTVTSEVRDHALCGLLAVLGGQSHRPSAESLKRLATALQSGNDFRLTLSRTLVLRRRQELFLVRERRGLLPLSVGRAARAIWDGRYIIENGSAAEIAIIPGKADTIAPDLPGAIRSALTATCPQLFDEKGFSVPASEAVRILPRLSLYADFMPVFDQPLAHRIALLVGAEPSPASPI